MSRQAGLRLAVFLGSALTAGAGCGQGPSLATPDLATEFPDGSTGADDAMPSLTLSPPSARVTVGRAQPFSASLAASWSVTEASGGTIDSTGSYVAPSVPGVYHVVATASGATATAAITVVPPGLDLVAGKLGGPGTADDVGLKARFNMLEGVWLDPAGVLYATDTYNNTIRQMVLATGRVTTLAGFLIRTSIASRSRPVCRRRSRATARATAMATVPMRSSPARTALRSTAWGTCSSSTNITEPSVRSI